MAQFYNDEGQALILMANDDYDQIGMEASDDRNIDLEDAQINDLILPYTPFNFDWTHLMNLFNVLLFCSFFYLCWSIISFVLILYLISTAQHQPNIIVYQIVWDVYRDTEEEEGRIVAPTDEQIDLINLLNNDDNQENDVDAQHLINPIQNLPFNLTQNLPLHNSIQSDDESYSSLSTNNSDDGDTDDRIMSSSSDIDNNDGTDRSSSISEHFSNEVQHSHVEVNPSEQSNRSQGQPIDRESAVTPPGDDINIINITTNIQTQKSTIIMHLSIKPSDANSTQSGS